MRVKMIRSLSEERPASIQDLHESQVFISTGTEYEVHALVVFEGGVHFQVVDDLPMINWYPMWYFEVVDPTIPDDWICNLFDDVLQMVLGPDFVARDEASYNSMVELEWDATDKFWARLKARSASEDDKSLL